MAKTFAGEPDAKRAPRGRGPSLLRLNCAAVIVTIRWLIDRPRPGAVAHLRRWVKKGWKRLSITLRCHAAAVVVMNET